MRRIKTKTTTSIAILMMATTILATVPNPANAVPVDFQALESLPVSSAQTWEFFNIDGESYLVGDNGRSLQFYRWSGNGFVDYRTMPDPAGGGYTREFFTIGDEHFLAVGIYQHNNTVNTDSWILRWDGKANGFVHHQDIPTNGASDIEAFVIDGEHYLAIGNYFNGSSYNVHSKIYKWTDGQFVEAQSMLTNGIWDWEFFRIGSDSYLAAANHYNGQSFDTDSRIYKWDGKGFFVHHSIPTRHAFDWRHFTIGTDHFLAIANGGNNASKIYKWAGSGFTEHQSLSIIDAYDWEYFTLADESYLVVANQSHGSNFSIDSVIYRWNGADFAVHQNLRTHRARHWRYFTINAKPYLVVANHSSFSKVYTADVMDLDTDGDGVPNDQDNCPDHPNPSQEDSDGDGRGDVCDQDGEGHCSVRLPVVCEGGEFSVLCQNVEFPPISLTGQAMAVEALDATWTTTDTTCLGAGWHVTLIADDHLRGTEDPDNHVIEIGENGDFQVHCLDTEIVPVSGDALNLPTCTNGPQAIPVENENPITVIYADQGDGMGTYDFVPHFEILVPGATIVDTYTTKIWVYIMAGP